MSKQIHGTRVVISIRWSISLIIGQRLQSADCLRLTMGSEPLKPSPIINQMPQVCSWPPREHAAAVKFPYVSMHSCRGAQLQRYCLWSYGCRASSLCCADRCFKWCPWNGGTIKELDKVKRFTDLNKRQFEDVCSASQAGEDLWKGMPHPCSLLPWLRELAHESWKGTYSFLIFFFSSGTKMRKNPLKGGWRGKDNKVHWCLWTTHGFQTLSSPEHGLAVLVIYIIPSWHLRFSCPSSLQWRVLSWWAESSHPSCSPFLPPPLLWTHLSLACGSGEFHMWNRDEVDFHIISVLLGQFPCSCQMMK